jgi:hypothetical protein
VSKKTIASADLQKRQWIAPRLSRFKAGDAESQRGATPDGGGGNQGS